MTNYRWLLAEARDTSDQFATYAYSCASPTSPVCHPSQITHGGSIVNFTAETKPDVLTVATWAFVASFDKRLRLIEVRNANARLRVYALTYETGSATGFSRLTSVRQYGKDAVITGVTIASGTALPPNSFT